MEKPRFYAGMNVAADDVRESPARIVEILKPTPIRWLRVHPLPNRSISQKGLTGVSFLEGIEYLCKNGYDLVVPIEVGVRTNVGTISIEDLDAFVEESYHESVKACRTISSVVRKYNRQLIFGIENEIDPKAWILQALPGIEWRSTFETWTKQALDFKLKYKRLNNILEGAREADPDAKTMTNIVAEDLRVYFRNFGRQLARYSDVLKEHSISLDRLTDEAIDWRLELRYLKNNLRVDYVGLDNYANWIIKYPVYGEETGPKIAEATELAGRPAFNAEFGYTTHRTFWEKISFMLHGRPSASRMQLEFFENSLRSIEKSPSVGTFPWVLITHPRRPAVPQQESYFGLLKMDSKGRLREEPAFNYYIEWLKGKLGTTQSD